MLGPKDAIDQSSRRIEFHADSLASFCNSLLREAGHLGLNCSISPDKVEFTNKSNQRLSLPLKRFSKLGRHQYQITQGQLPAQESIEWLIDATAEAMGEVSLQKRNEFLSRVTASNMALQKILAACQDRFKELYHKRDISLIDSESLLYAGHSFHPYPKNRGGLEDQDFESYSPEYGNEFKLHWAVVAAKNFHELRATHYQKDWILEILKSNLTSDFFKAHIGPALEQGMKILPIHPWQVKHLRENSRVRELIESGALRLLEGDERPMWRATSSVRSIYSAHLPSMLKFSLSMRLTNSIRHLQEVEVVRGMQVHDVLHTKKGQEFQKLHPEFSVLFEGAFAALKDISGKLIIESIVVARDNPFTKENSLRSHVLATLNQRGPSGRYYLEAAYNLKAPAELRVWFKQFLKVVLAPLIDAQSNYGIYLGAHQQNIVLTLGEDGMPKKSYFRDCQGTGYSELGHSLYSSECKSLVRENGNILTHDMGSMLFCYYLIINSTFNTIVTLSEIANCDETIFIEELREFLLHLRKLGPRDTSTLDYLLESEALWQKGNFGCCLRDINENTIANPMSIYNLIPNPLKVKSND